MAYCQVIPKAPCVVGSATNNVIHARSQHPGGLNVLLGDASGRFIADTVDVTIYKNLGHRSDGNTIGDY